MQKSMKHSTPQFYLKGLCIFLLFLMGIATQAQTNRTKKQSKKKGKEPMIEKMTLMPPTPSVKWVKSHGGGEQEEARKIVQTADGGYVVAGFTESRGLGKADMWIFKTNEDSNIRWEKTYGSKTNDYANDLIPTDDGGYLLVGSTEQNENKDGLVVKVDSEGNKQWQKVLGESKNDGFTAGINAKDGGFIVVGTRHASRKNYNQATGKWDYELNHAIWMMMLDRAGNEFWSQLILSTNMVSVTDVVATKDDGFIIIANTRFDNSKHEDAWIIKADINGNKLWEQRIGGDKTDILHEIAPVYDGFIMSGVTNSMGIGGDAWLVKIDKKGKVLWEKNYGGERNDEAYALSISDDGGFLIGGYYGSGTGTEPSMWLLQTKNNGDLLWEQKLGKTYFDRIEGICQTFGGEIILVGYTPVQALPNEDGTYGDTPETMKTKSGDAHMVKLSYY